MIEMVDYLSGLDRVAGYNIEGFGLGVYRIDREKPFNAKLAEKYLELCRISYPVDYKVYFQHSLFGLEGTHIVLACSDSGEIAGVSAFYPWKDDAFLPRGQFGLNSMVDPRFRNKGLLNHLVQARADYWNGDVLISTVAHPASYYAHRHLQGYTTYPKTENHGQTVIEVPERIRWFGIQTMETLGLIRPGASRPDNYFRIRNTYPNNPHGDTNPWQTDNLGHYLGILGEDSLLTLSVKEDFEKSLKIPLSAA